MGRSSKNHSSLPTVKFDKTQVTNSIKVDLLNNLESLTDIAAKDRSIVFEEALRAILSGGDTHSLSKFLINLGLAKRRAAEISVYLSNNATILMAAERQKELGINYAIWRHSGVPCGEQDTAHREADGKKFPVTEGLYIGGRFTLPGRDWGCHCTSRSVIARLSAGADLDAKNRTDENNEHTPTELRWKIFPFFGFLKKNRK